MALWLDPGAEPQTDKEKADLDAIEALKYSTALELKEQGNEYVKTGKKHYSDAIDCYTRAINQKALSEAETSVIFANRAHVNLLLWNNRRALEDADQAIKLSPTNAKAFYRAAKASLVLDLLKETISYCERGLEVPPDNDDLKKLANQANNKLTEIEKRKAEASQALIAAKELLSAIDDRGVKIGKAMYSELTGRSKPFFDKNKILHWPVLLLYAEVMSTDFIEDFCETDMISSHLDVMYSGEWPLPWDKEKAYTRKNIELYYEVGSSVCLSKTELLRNFVEGTAAEKSMDEVHEDNASTGRWNPAGIDFSRWVKVNERKTLHDVLKEPNFVIPEIPVFCVVSKQSSFYDKFKSGKWAIP